MGMLRPLVLITRTEVKKLLVQSQKCARPFLEAQQTVWLDRAPNCPGFSCFGPFSTSVTKFSGA